MTTHRSDKLRRANKLYGRTLALGLAMLAGALTPQAHNLSSVIPYLLITMLFFAFLDITVSRQVFSKSILAVLAANLSIAFLAFIIVGQFDSDLALVAFMTGITPTAAAAPVFVGFLGGRVDYVLASVLLTNVSVAAVIPFALPLVVGTSMHVSTWEVLQSVLLVVFAPMVLAGAFHYLPGKAQIEIRRFKRYSFALWLMVLFFVSSKATYFMRHDLTVTGARLAEIALISLVICMINFGVGSLLGGKEYRREASQSLGQKNNSFTIWLALTFVSPLAALGPTFYVVYHNLYNSLQLY
ncbi:MAG: hypothetical protein HY866_23265, partial [Chloroflexi bacterium]|nr:hypothetical protein [Chloroflexota bacterium]